MTLQDHQNWLQHPHTQQVLQELLRRREKLLAIAETKASYGKDEESVPLLLKTRAIKEIYDSLISPEKFTAQS